MEIEAWFLSEHSHFNRIDGNLTPEKIHSTLAFHPENDDMELRETPAEDLNRSYQIAGKSYGKDKNKVERTINALDFSQMYFDPKPSSLQQLRTELESYFN